MVILWKKLFGDNELLNIKIESEIVDDSEHSLLVKLVNEYDPEKNKNDKIEFFKSKIQKMFDTIKFTFYSENGDEVLDVSGRFIDWKEISNVFFDKYNETSIDHIRICGVQEIILNDSLTFPGKNLSIMAPSIFVPHLIILDLSGKDATDNGKNDILAKSGINSGENGENGDDGIAGGSAGNLLLLSSKIINEANLKIVLNGGNGSKGQDGGNGAIGSDGIGKKFEDTFDGWYKAHAFLASLGNSIWSGYIGELLGGFHTTILSNKITRKFSVSTYRVIKIENKFVSFFTKPFTNVISSSHFLDMYQGTDGSPGGKGGINGNGGEGGKQGTCIAQTPNGDNIRNLKIEATDGINGNPGKPGKNGQNGKDGWDIAVTKKTLEFCKDYGTNHNQKFEIEFSKDYIDGSLYIQDLDKGSGSYCYAKIKTKECERKMLLDNERDAEKKRDSEKKAEAIARKTNAINMSSAQQRFDGLCQEFSEEKAEQEEEMEEETEKESEVNRLAESFDIPKEPLYVPKERHEVPIIPAEIFDLLDPKNVKTWNEIWKATTSVNKINELYKKCPESLMEKLKKKILLTTLRLHTKASKGEFVRIMKLYLESQRQRDLQILKLIRRQRKMKKLENDIRNCAPFLIPKPQDLKEDINPCVGALIGNSMYSGVLQEAIVRITALKLSVKNYKKYVELAELFEKVEINGESIQKLRIEFIKKIKIEKSEKAEIDKIVKKICQQSNTPKDFEKFINQFTNDTNKLLIVYNQIYETICANQVLSNVLKLCAKAQANEIQLDKNPKLFGENTLMTDWLEIANNEGHFQKLINYVKNNGMNSANTQNSQKTSIKSAGARLILAWETNCNLRIYNKGNLIEDHMQTITDNVQHLEIDELTGSFTQLWLNYDRILLENDRNDSNFSFEKRLHEAETKFKCQNLLPSEFVAVTRWCSRCGKYEEGKLTLNQMGALIPRCEKLVSFIGKKGKLLQSSLELLCMEFPIIGVSFINSLLEVFEVDGCHIDYTTFKYILETVFASTNFISNKYFFPGIIFQTEQSEWIDEFFLFSAENSIMSQVSRKPELRKRLKLVIDENLKILCSKKLQTQKITPEELLAIVDLMKDAHGAYPDLLEVDLNKWSAVIKDTQIFSKLNIQKGKFLDEKQRNLALFWCCKLASANYSLEEVEKVFAILGAQEKMKFDIKVFGKLVQRLCNNEIVAGSKDHRPNISRIFAHVVTRFENFSPIPKILEIRISRNDKEIAEELMGYSRADGDAYTFEEWITILKKRNESTELISYICDELMEQSNADLYMKAIEECIKIVKEKKYLDKSLKKPSEFMTAFQYHFNYTGSTDIDAFLLVITNCIIA
uniref:Uncharacterized protein n=1 Tax=Panagrolaimus sp. PS1159 TaxID=55785 RepID=A0AC35GSZ2_9BILA